MSLYNAHLRIARPTDHMDDLLRFYREGLVFYLPDAADWQRAVERMAAAGYQPVRSFNPYWDVRGVTFEDVDGYRVVLQRAVW